MPETTETRVDPLDLRGAARHVMVDFNQMQTFTANPLIMKLQVTIKPEARTFAGVTAD